MASPGMEPIPITSVPVQQLAQIRQSLQESVESLAEQHAMLTRVAMRSSAAVKSVETLAESKTGALFCNSSPKISICHVASYQHSLHCPAPAAVSAGDVSAADQPVLLPLTSSLYVKGKLADTEKVLVNIGTDYFVEVRPAASSRWPLLQQGKQQQWQLFVNQFLDCSHPLAYARGKRCFHACAIFLADEHRKSNRLL